MRLFINPSLDALANDRELVVAAGALAQELVGDAAEAADAMAWAAVNESAAAVLDEILGAGAAYDPRE